MSNAAHGPVLCGFGDAEAGLGGLAWDVGEPGALLLSEGEVRAATFALEEGGGATALEIRTGDVTVEATLIPQTAAITLGGKTSRIALNVITCASEVRFADEAQTSRCPGQISRWFGDPLEGAATFRHLAINAGHDSLLVAEAHGETGARGHGDELSEAWLLQGEDVTRFEDVFISTEYDGDGDPTRLGLELWPAEAERASRAAATRVAGSALGGVKTGAAWAGLFRCNSHGSEGSGSYLLWRG
jgi:hypothetical protein